MAENRHIRRLNSRHDGRKPAICAHRSNPLLLWIALLALAVQILVIQTHIHATTFAAARDGVSASGAAPAALPNSPDRFPVGDDPANCPSARNSRISVSLRIASPFTLRRCCRARSFSGLFTNPDRCSQPRHIIGMAVRHPLSSKLSVSSIDLLKTG